MPTYEYECTACGHRFEKMQPMSAKPIRKCPECGGAVDKLISGGAAVHTKGTAPPCGNAQSPCALQGGCCPGSACAARRR